MINVIASIFAGSAIAAGQDVFFRNSGGFATGQVLAKGAFDQNVTGVTAGDDVVLRNNAGTLTIGTATAGTGITAGGDVGLSSAGAVTQTAQGVIDSAGLAVQAAGGVTLAIAINDVDNLAVSTTGQIEFRDANALTVGSVTISSTSFSATLNGLSSSNNDINLRAGSLDIQQAVNAGAADVRIVAATTVSQASTGPITADELGVQAGGAVDLCDALTNDVNTLAVNTTGTVDFHDDDGLIIGQVAAGGSAGIGFATATGIVTGGSDANIQADSLSILQPINAGAGTVRLQATAGGMTQAGTAVITGTALSVQASAAATLDTAANSVGTFAADATGNVYFRNAGAFTVGQVVGGGCVPTTVTGVDSGATVELVTVSGLLTIGTATAGTGITATSAIALNSGGGITQTAQGALVSPLLAAQATGSVSLAAAAGNDLDDAAIETTGTIELRDSDGLDIIETTVSLPQFSATITGLHSGGSGDISVRTGGALEINSGGLINAGTGDVRLVSATTVNQVLAANEHMVIANELGIIAGGAVTMNSLDNDVDRLAVRTTGLVEYRDADGLAIGTVVAGGSAGIAFTPDVVGITSGGSNVNLGVGGALSIEAQLNAGAGDIRIVAGSSTAGGVSQTVNGDITSAALGIVATGLVGLCAADNDVDTLAIQTNGVINFRDVDTFAIGTVTAGGGAGFDTDISGLDSNGNDINLGASSMSIDQPLDAGAATIRIVTTGTVTQTTAGTITAAALGIEAGGDVTLTAASPANDVNILAVETTGDLVEFVDADGLIIGSVGTTVTCVPFGGATGIATAGGNIHLRTDQRRDRLSRHPAAAQCRHRRHPPPRRHVGHAELDGRHHRQRAGHPRRHHGRPVRRRRQRRGHPRRDRDRRRRVP